MNDPFSTPFAIPLPTLTEALAQIGAWEWPRPPFAHRFRMVALPVGPQPCRIETPSGAAVEGRLLHFDAQAETLRFSLGEGGEALPLPFAKIRRLTMTSPWSLERAAPDAPVERLSLIHI